MPTQLSKVNNCNRTLAIPAAAAGILSTRLTDPGPDYVWFDCETEY
jgi:hypothetical protein